MSNGAKLHVNLTDDGWFESGHEAAVHLNGMRLRAIETRRPLGRSSNSGETAVIGPDGCITAALAFGMTGALRHEIPLREDRSIYIRLGEWPLRVGRLTGLEPGQP